MVRVLQHIANFFINPPKTGVLSWIHFIFITFGIGFIILQIGNSLEKEESTEKKQLGKIIATVGFCWPFIIFFYYLLFTNDLRGIGNILRESGKYLPRF